MLLCTCIHIQNGRGKVVVLGSAHMFHDHYIDKEENSKLQDVIFRWLTSDDITLNAIDAEDPEVRIPRLCHTQDSQKIIPMCSHRSHQREVGVEGSGSCSPLFISIMQLAALYILQLLSIEPPPPIVPRLYLSHYPYL